MSVLFDSRSATAYERYVQSLRDALRARDWIYDGSFALSNDVDVYSKVMRDPVAAHAIMHRRHLVAGTEWRIEPASDDLVDKKAAEVVEELIDNIEGFTDARIRLANSIFAGSAYGLIVGDRKEKRLAGGEKRSWWCPYSLVDVDRRRFRRYHDAELDTYRWQFYSVKQEEWQPLEHPEWFVHCVFNDTEASLGYGDGMLNVVYQFQAAKSRVIQDNMAASERFGQGMMLVGIDNMRDQSGKPTRASSDGSGSTIAQTWARELEKHKARHILVHDSRDKVELVTGFSEGHKLGMDMISYFDNAIVTSILGATLPTMANEGGSYALGKEQGESTQALIQADRMRLSDDLSRDLVSAIWRYNREQLVAEGLDNARMPSFRLVNQKLEDPIASSQVITNLLAAGFQLRKDECYRKAGFTIPLPEDETVGKKAALGGFDLRTLDIDDDSADLPEDQEDRPTGEPLSAEALNGAQVTALQGIVQNVAANMLPAEAAIELILAGFPSVPRESAQRMIDSASVFRPTENVAEGVQDSNGANGARANFN